MSANKARNPDGLAAGSLERYVPHTLRENRYV